MEPIQFYHGSSTIKDEDYKLLPPIATGIIQEAGRVKNLDKVFFTPDIGTAKIYAGRSKNRNGGNKKVFRVIPMGKIEKINDLTFCSDWAFIELIYTKQIHNENRGSKRINYTGKRAGN